MKSVDIIVIGGGLSGSATALGLVREGAGKVVLFDEHLPSQRLSRGNFGLTWFMCKGATHPVYAQWCRMAAQKWPDFAADLKEETGYDVELEWTGGAVHAFGEEEFNAHSQSVESLRKVCESVGIDYPVKMLDRSEFQDLIPNMQLGEDVTGAMYTSEQGHVNPLKLLTALRCAFQKKGGIFKGGESIGKIIPHKNGTVTVKTVKGSYQCEKLVIAAGHGSTRLLKSLGEKLHIYPSRGQLMVTERQKRMLRVPILCVRQTVDGTFLIGLTTEDTAMDTRTTAAAMKDEAINAIRLFPQLAKYNWVRAWGAIRVMTPDGAPIYSRVQGHDNITVLALHSAVSLAPMKISAIAPWILGKNEAEQLKHFTNGRFNNA
ncbi:Related to opine oxidase, subunit B [Desulfamplus magnetovallimortis]|uniref:Related to opine oxidase, subunit B n=1 Tax=Desulfamplus magnetovallimortis TaxID=1246637 RepID=A0A1W1HAD5_9BACT|nr:FAD-binding oxidoreductase [Desulfamplus magnetovallimortis]SLM29464.1 Related to opine oxidase, subunit B [Desulfamplus magnetovallimortis]